MVTEGSTTATASETYVERFLAPALKPGQVVILDDLLGAHKGERIRELVETRGCELIFLLAYSPDFSAIEDAFSKVKMLLKKAACRTREALVVEEIGRAPQDHLPSRKGLLRPLRPPSRGSMFSKVRCLTESLTKSSSQRVKYSPCVSVPALNSNSPSLSAIALVSSSATGRDCFVLSNRLGSWTRQRDQLDVELKAGDPDDE
jgi:transposase